MSKMDGEVQSIIIIALKIVFTSFYSQNVVKIIAQLYILTKWVEQCCGVLQQHQTSHCIGIIQSVLICTLWCSGIIVTRRHVLVLVLMNNEHQIVCTLIPSISHVCLVFLHNNITCHAPSWCRCLPGKQQRKQLGKVTQFTQDTSEALLKAWLSCTVQRLKQLSEIFFQHQ